MFVGRGYEAAKYPPRRPPLMVGMLRMSIGTPRPRRPRPLADAPLDALLEDGARDLARGWLLALLEDRALEAAAQLPAADLAREAPELLAAAARALASDAELARLGPGGDLRDLAGRAGELAGARDAAATAAAIDDLRAVLWAASLAHMPQPSPEQVADLADRTVHVAATLRAAALSAHARVAGSAPEPEPGLAAVPDPRSAGDAGQGEVVADEGWIGAVREHVAGAASGGSGLALLLVEVEDHERLASAAESGAGPLGAAGRAIRDALRRPDVIGFEEAGRVWVIAAGSGRRGAEALAERLAAAVAAVAAPHGSPLAISVGIAVYGEDAWDAEGLIGAADEAALAARASGARPPGRGGEPPPGPRLVS